MTIEEPAEIVHDTRPRRERAVMFEMVAVAALLGAGAMLPDVSPRRRPRRNRRPTPPRVPTSPPTERMEKLAKVRAALRQSGLTGKAAKRERRRLMQEVAA